MNLKNGCGLRLQESESLALKSVCKSRVSLAFALATISVYVQREQLQSCKGGREVFVVDVHCTDEEEEEEEEEKEVSDEEEDEESEENKEKQASRDKTLGRSRWVQPEYVVEEALAGLLGGCVKEWSRKFDDREFLRCESQHAQNP